MHDFGSSGFSSDDDVPITKLSNVKRKEHRNLSPGMQQLTRFSQEKCQICENLFFNKYDLLVHNSSHIIIPLMRGTLKQCRQCDRYFETAMDLNIHEEVQHFEVPDLSVISQQREHLNLVENVERQLRQIVTNQPVVRCDSLINNYMIRGGLLGTFVDQPVIRLEDTVNRLVIESFCNNDININSNGTFNNGDVNNDSDSDVEFVPNVVTNGFKIEDSEDGYESDDVEIIEENNVGPRLKSKLVFEDDLDDEEVSDKSPNGPPYSNMIMLGTKVVNKKISGRQSTADPPSYTEDRTLPPSVHYDDLIQPESHSCGICNIVFYNQFDLILHKTRFHMEINTTPKNRSVHCCLYCESYISGPPIKIYTHMKNFHPKIWNTRQKTTPSKPKRCPKCNWKFHKLFVHLSKVHRLKQCPFCQGDFDMKHPKLHKCEISSQFLSEIAHPKKLEKYLPIFEDENIWNGRAPHHIFNDNPNSFTAVVSFEDEDNGELRLDANDSEENKNKQKKNVIIVKMCEICSILLKTSIRSNYIQIGVDHATRIGGRLKMLHCKRCDKRYELLKVFKRVTKPRGNNAAKYPTSNMDRLKNIKKRFKMLK